MHLDMDFLCFASDYNNNFNLGGKLLQIKMVDSAFSGQVIIYGSDCNSTSM